jgi:DNA-binding response OmpR family regulator
MASARPHRIVAVDDDERTLRLLVDALGTEDRHVLTFSNGEVLLSYLEDAEDCDLLILDIEMPEIGGFSIARAVRQMPKMNRVPILALTGMSGPDVAVRILEAGADAYRSKPVDIIELRTLATALIAAGRPADA